MIIIVTLCAIILAVAGYFVVPAYQYNKAEKEPVYEGRMLIAVNQLVCDYYPQKIVTFLYGPDVLLDSMREAGADEYNNTEQILSLIQDKKYSVIPFLPTGTQAGVNNSGVNNSVVDNSVLEITFSGRNPDLVKSFLNSLYRISDEKLKNAILPNAEKIVIAYERLLNVPAVLPPMLQFSEFGFSDYVLTKDFVETKHAVLQMVDEPVISNAVSQETYRKSYMIKGLVLVFASVFLSIFLAFVLNTVRNIKKDEEAMKKIHDALGKTDKK